MVLVRVLAVDVLLTAAASASVGSAEPPHCLLNSAARSGLKYASVVDLILPLTRLTISYGESELRYIRERGP